MTQEVVVHQPAGALKVLASDSNMELVQQAIGENIGVGGITEFDLEQVKIPSGGTLTFTVTTLEGDKAEKSLVGVIVLARDARAFWKKSADDEDASGNAPPDCHSNDGVVGIGSPGGDCATCPMAQFGSDPKGNRGQACKAIRRLFLLRGSSLLPTVVSLPPTSIKPIKKYMVQLAGQAIPYWSVLTKIGLVGAQNAKGQKYATATFEFAGQLDEGQRAKAQQYSDLMKTLVGTMTVDAKTIRKEGDEF